MFFPPHPPHCLETPAGEVSSGFQPTRPMIQHLPAPGCSQQLVPPAPHIHQPHSPYCTYLFNCSIVQLPARPELPQGHVCLSPSLSIHLPEPPNLAQCLAGGRSSVDVCQMSNAARGEIMAEAAEQVSGIAWELSTPASI